MTLRWQLLGKHSSSLRRWRQKPIIQTQDAIIQHIWLQVTTFTDCVNCLIAFTNNPHSLDVSLNAIAFLRFCAMKLAEGAIGVPYPLCNCTVATLLVPYNHVLAPQSWAH